MPLFVIDHGVRVALHGVVGGAAEHLGPPGGDVVAVLFAFFALMYGNVFGLTRIETDRWGGLPLTMLLSNDVEPVSIKGLDITIEASETPRSVTIERVWLDDIRPMPAGFGVHARTAAEAVALLRQGGVSLISLDHDLDSVVPIRLQPRDPGCGPGPPPNRTD